MAQTRETAANTAAQSLFTKNDPTDIKNEPELSAISKKFIYHDINKQIKLSTAKQELLTLVVLTANNTPEDIPAHVEGALRAGATPEQVHESIFHCTPYVGLPKVKTALERFDQVMEMLKIKPCAPAGTTTDQTRHEAGLAVQRAIFGAENIDKMNASAPADQKHINDYLSANCFGDYYTRKVLDVKERELSHLQQSLLSADANHRPRHTPLPISPSATPVRICWMRSPLPCPTSAIRAP